MKGATFMTNRKSESGLVIVEASVVFPVMFVVIFFLIFLGNAFLQKCRVEAIVNEMAIDGAAYCADPMLDDIEASGVPNLGSAQIMPYRFFLTGEMANIESKIESELTTKIAELDTGLFSRMKPRVAADGINVKFNSYFVYSTFSVDVDYSIMIPVRLLGASEYLSYGVATRIDMPVSDSAEFIRNVDMVEDYLERTGAMEEIEKAINKVKDLVGIGSGEGEGS